MNAGNVETVLITGASSGIGLELARYFAAEKGPGPVKEGRGNGCRIVLVARNRAALETLAKELEKDHQVRVIVLSADLSLPDTAQRIFRELQEASVHVDVLVNNAGFGAIGRFAELPLERQMEIIRVNVSALTELTRLFLPGMIRAGRGGILNVGSVAGFVTGPGMAVYYATKAFVLSFTEALAAELEGTGVTVSVLCPGPTSTNFGKVAGAENARLYRMSNIMSAGAVARQGHRDFRRGKVVAVSGLMNKLTVLGIRLSPRWILRKMAGKFNGLAK